MINLLIRDTIEDKLKSIKWEYVSPNKLLIKRNENFVFKNRNGMEITFGFDEICHWLYDEDYVGCTGECDSCLTPIC